MGSAQNPATAAPRWLFPYRYRSRMLETRDKNQARKYGLWGSLWDKMGTLSEANKQSYKRASSNTSPQASLFSFVAVW